MDKRFKKIKNDVLQLRSDIIELIEEELRNHSTYYYQKRGIGSVSLNNLKNPKLRKKVGTETLLRNLIKIMNIK